MRRGQEVHAAAEAYVKGEIKKLPVELELFEEEFAEVLALTKGKRNLAKYDVFTEQQWAFTKDWVPCDWFHRDTRVRIVVDLGILNKKDNVLTIIDHKTGKARPDHEHQRSLYATGGFAKLPGVATINTAMWYLDQGFINTESNEMEVYEREQHEELIKRWDKESAPMLRDTKFATTPNRLCGWCDFSKNNGGPCKY